MQMARDWLLATYGLPLVWIDRFISASMSVAPSALFHSKIIFRIF